MTGIRRVRFTSPHPKDMRPDTFAAMAETPAVCEHLHYPLQSGSDRVLAAMHRGTPPSATSTASPRPARAVADLAVSTDIIVGFPGETDDDFERTLEVAAAAEYDYAYTFIFSPRPGTEAATHGRPTSSTRPWSASASHGCASWSSAPRSPSTRPGSGRIEEVLVEGPSKRDPSVTSGRTRQNKLVHFTPPTPLRTGSYATVEITRRRAAPPPRATSSSSLAEPTHRLRIPVAAL